MMNKGIPQLLLYIGACLLIALAPGPDICFVLAQSAGLGAMAGLCVTAGLLSGLCVHILLALFGLATVLNRAPRVMTLLSLFGAGYLVYMAWEMWGATLALQSAEQRSYLDFYLRGVILNLSNPKVILFFVAFLPRFLPTQLINDSPHKRALWLMGLGGIFILCAGSVMSLAALLGGTLSHVLAASPHATQWLHRGAAIAILLIAGWILAPLVHQAFRRKAQL